MVANNHKGQIMIKNCSVFGHRIIEITQDLENKLFEIFKNLIDEG